MTRQFRPEQTEFGEAPSADIYAPVRKAILPENCRFVQPGNLLEIDIALHCESAGGYPPLNRGNRRLFATSKALKKMGAL